MATLSDENTTNLIPLPDGWEVATSQSGKPYIKVRKSGGGFGGGATAFRNTKEGQAAEQQSIHRSVALSQAVIVGGDDIYSILDTADRFYAWLKAAAPGNPVAASPGGIPSSRQPSGDTPSVTPGEGQSPKQSKADWGQPEATGEGVMGSPVGCAHTNRSPLLPSGRATKEGTFFCLDCKTLVREA